MTDEVEGGEVRAKVSRFGRARRVRERGWPYTGAACSYISDRACRGELGGDRGGASGVGGSRGPHTHSKQ